jgi:hypothetical protein
MSTVLDNIHGAVAREMGNISAVAAVPDGVRVTTHCMYPSNGLVRVFVRGGAETIVASDDGEAVGEALGAGIMLREPDKVLRSVVKSQGLQIHNGIIHTPRVDLETAGLAILLVANAAKEAAQWLYDHHKIKRDRDFRKLLGDFLRTTFSEQVAPTKIVGASNTPHNFASVISFANGRKLIIDPVIHDPTSINSRVVANLDVRNMKNPRIDQRIVYDDEERWSAADLNLLNVGATVVAFSQARDVINRVALQNQDLH